MVQSDTSTFRLAMFAAVLLVAAGCATPKLTVDDAIIGPQGGTRLAAHLAYERIRGLRDGVPGVEMHFRIDSQLVSTIVADEDGCGTLDCRLGSARPQDFVATALWKGQELSASGRFFAWTADRTALAVDIDHTICEPDRDDLYFHAVDNDSRVIGDSAAVLNALSRDYDILYLTARPRFLLAKTRQWLRDRGFPEGPVVAAPGWRAAMHAGRYKFQTLARLRRDVPNLLIGIGDKELDVRAYSRNQMLAIRLGRASTDEPISDVLMLPDWAAIRSFFETNRAVLTNPQELRTALEAGQLEAKLAGR